MLKGLTAFVTGSNRGIGKAIVTSLAVNGANIVAHARRRSDEFLESMESLSSRTDVSIKPIFFDMADSGAMKETVIKEVIMEKTPVDILVNNAGIPYFGLFQMTSIKKIREIFDINFFAQLELTQLLLRTLARRKGCVINMGSVMGLDLPRGGSAYGTSKAALLAFTKVLSAECGPLGVRVNCVAPGMVDTAMSLQMGDKAVETMVEWSALGRVASPEEIAKIVVFLASPSASYINGECIRADGGKSF